MVLSLAKVEGRSSEILSFVTTPQQGLPHLPEQLPAVAGINGPGQLALVTGHPAAYCRPHSHIISRIG